MAHATISAATRITAAWIDQDTHFKVGVFLLKSRLRWIAILVGSD